MPQEWFTNLYNIFPEQEHETTDLASNTDGVPGRYFSAGLNTNEWHRDVKNSEGRSLTLRWFSCLHR